MPAVLAALGAVGLDRQLHRGLLIAFLKGRHRVRSLLEFVTTLLSTV
jgi:hypothetical protein